MNDVYIMRPRWSKTRAAINTGYGIPRYHLPQHPEILGKPPYWWQPSITPLAVHPSFNKRGGKCLRGRGNYTYAAMEGGFDVGILTDLASNFGSGIVAALKMLAEQTGSSLINLLKNPSELLRLAKKMMPKLGRVLAKFFGKEKEYEGITNEISNKREQLKKYLQQLKETDPERYQQMVQRLRAAKNRALNTQTYENIDSTYM